LHHQKSIIVIAGPTAVGKTTYAIEVARYFNTVILSADSRQCFKELNIGVARPTPEELAQVPHFFIASHSIHDDISAAWYETYALELLKKLFQQYNTVVVTGGTGLYIKALVEGLDLIPPVENHIRQHVISHYETHGIGWLQEQLQQLDPWFVKEGEMKNPQRMMRALEVVLATGRSIISYRNTGRIPRNFNIYQIGLERPREELYERINQRVDVMMAAGLEAEARELYPYRHLNALQTVGYKELFDYFDNKCSLDEAVALIKQNTRRYAKRQMTWFKKQQGMKWINLSQTDSISPVIAELSQ